MYPIRQDYISHNRPGTALSAEGAVCHSTATQGATDENEQAFFDSVNRNASAHGFIDWDSITETIPWNERAFHAMNAANCRYIGVELCEPKDSDPDRYRKFAEVWNRAAWYFADMFVKKGWGIDRLHSHKWVSETYHESTHTDPYAYFAKYGKTFADFNAAVVSEMTAINNPTAVQPSRGAVPATCPAPDPAAIAAAPTAFNYSYPNNAVCINDTLFIRDANGVRIPGVHYVAIGDPMTVLDVSGSKQLALVEYPTASGVKRGYVTNAVNCIKYRWPNSWVNGSTSEPVLDENGVKIGSLNARERATRLYKRGSQWHVVYVLGDGPKTKSGYVNYGG
jgi:hypothetical protein